MKKPLLYISLFAILFAVACTSRTNNQQAVQPVVPAFDTTGLAAFQEWQYLNERKDASDYMQEEAQASSPVRTAAKKTVKKKTSSAPVVITPAPEVPAETNTGSTETNEGSGTVASETSNQAKEKKGISNAAKGTVIGAVSGAVIGAVINKKNRVVGGVIGGVLGGGVGYGIGRKMDKKEDQETTEKSSQFSELANILN
jgi:hypothetical protein